MTTNKPREEVEELTQHFYDILSTPMTNICKFYTLYYIDEEIDIDGFDFYLMETAREQAKAFYNYSIYTCVGEYTNLHLHFSIDDVRLGSIGMAHPDIDPAAKPNMRPNISTSAAEGIIRDLEKAIEENTEEEVGETVKDMMFYLPQKAEVPIHVNQIKLITTGAEEFFDAYSRPQNFLKACEFIFGHNWGEQYVEDRPPYIKKDPRHGTNEFGWHAMYGGDGWERVAKTAQLKQEFENETYVDLMWSVEHNNGNFIDKIPDLLKADTEPVTKVLNREWEESDKLQNRWEDGYTRKLIAANSYDRIIPVLLSEARDGNIRPLYRIAKTAFTELKDRRLRPEMFPQTKPLAEILEDEGGISLDKGFVK